MYFMAYWDDDRLGVFARILSYYARVHGFDPCTVQTFVCMNMSIFIKSGCFLCIIIMSVLIFKDV
jgi:hypothetical protein